MATIADLLMPTTTIGLHLVAGHPSDLPVSGVSVIESLDAIAHAIPGSLLVLTPPCTSQSASYEFDIAVRQAASIGVSALLFTERPGLSPTTTRLAERSDLALLGCTDGTSVAELVITLDQLLRGDSGTMITRALAALDQVQRLSPQDRLQDILEAVSQRLGSALSISDDGEPIVVNGRIRYCIAASADDDATRLAIPGIAAALSRWQAGIDAERDLPEQARSEVLSELLIRESAPVTAQLMDRLRASGLSLDATHQAFCVSQGKTVSTVDLDLLNRRLRRERVRELAAPHVPAQDGWSVAAVEDDLLLIRTLTRTREVSERADDSTLHAIMRALHQEFPDTALFFGSGTAQTGLGGLQQSAKEARIAAESASSRARPWLVEVFDSTGVNRLLAELNSSWAGRRIVTELLAPLEDLGPDRAWTSMETLHAYLDARGSLLETGRKLHLHPNAVAYRIRRLREKTGWDLDDPELRFALQLACRVRMMNQRGA
jgi:sugar diacid utilization regulator